MKKSNTTLALMAAIAASASMAYAATDDGTQKKWLPGRMMSGSVSFYSGNVDKGDSICILYTYDDKGRIVEMEGKKYNKDTDSFDKSELYSYEYDETTGRETFSLMKIYDSETGEYVDRRKSVYTYTKDNDWPAVSEEYEKSDKDADWVLSVRQTRTYEYDPVCGKVCKRVFTSGPYTLTETITYDADGVPQEYVNTTYYGSGNDYSEQKLVCRNIEWTDGYTIDFSKSNTWQFLSEALEASCKYECQEQDISMYDGTTTTKNKNSKVEYVRTVDNGKISYKRVIDSRADDGKYRVVQHQQTDEWGGYNESVYEYKDLDADEVPSQAKLDSQSKNIFVFTSPDDYTARRWRSGDVPTEMYLDYENTVATRTNPTFGYIENKTETEKRYNADGSLCYRQVVTRNYSDYKEFVTDAIARIEHNALQPRRVYTTSGVCVGNSVDNLPSGIYIVREGGRSMKVKK